MNKRPNYRVKHKENPNWREVYVSHENGQVEGTTYRLSWYEESPDWSVEPLHTPKTDSHYTKGDIECVDYLYDNMPVDAFIGGLEWNVKKYLHRWRYKENPVKDLRKARDYLNTLIETMEGNKPKFKEWKDD